MPDHPSSGGPPNDIQAADTAIVARTPDEIPRPLEPWEGAVDEVVLRAITGKETLEEYQALLRAAKP